MRRRLTIGEVAKRTGVPVKTLRFYSNEGLLPPTGRSPGGYRLYGEDDLARIDRIRTLRDVGLDLATIRAVLADAESLDRALRRRLRAIGWSGTTGTGARARSVMESCWRSCGASRRWRAPPRSGHG
ncbi:MerR family transcriptional regulator [Sorangium sp. So ce385]|uniref:MerR family transcriptional regulator n=1 Tax=Sorangium sp. So ce385 TaxID=3133308 RepID=UPI003F5C2E25